ncbi:MAG TPA: glycoside hydrolase [Flavobacteriales bacterium]|nr:glycoside hydrolase [Flavobacteriales bacterium]
MSKLSKLALLLIAAVCFQCGKDETPSVVPNIYFPIDVSALESPENSTFEFPLVLDRSTDREVTVHYETNSLTAIEGEDFLPASGTVSFAPGETSATIIVEIVIDEYIEEDEQFRVVLTQSQNGVFLNGSQQAIGTIRNDDTAIQVTTEGYVSADSYSGKSLVWSDEFDESEINLNNWTYDLGAHGWGNQELQLYTSNSQNSYVHDGNLMIVAKNEGNYYTSARMKSIDLQEFQYGRIDVRALLPKGQGIWPAIWMLGANFPTAGWPACGEIDIMELIGSSPNYVHGTVHYGDDYTQHQFTGQGTSISFGQTFSDEFHVFSIDWNEQGITWYLDDVEFFSIDQTVSGNQNYPFDNPFFFILNIAVGGEWPGYPDETTEFPQYMAVDYVRVFQ